MPSEKYRMEEIDVNTYTTRLRLHLRISSVLDEGAYKCAAKNSIGDSEGTIQIYGRFHLPLPPPLLSNKQLPLSSLNNDTQLRNRWRRRNHRPSCTGRTAKRRTSTIRKKWTSHRDLRKKLNELHPTATREPRCTVSFLPRTKCPLLTAVSHGSSILPFILVLSL